MISKGKAAAGGALIMAVSIIAAFEGYRPAPYADPIGIPTVCYGHTGSDVTLGQPARTAEQCKSLLSADLQTAWDIEDRTITVELEPWTRAALASFIFNVGESTWRNSSVLALINQGKVTAACDALLKYHMAGGKALQGLLRRREAERELCLGMEVQNP
jgi:lysozyme